MSSGHPQTTVVHAARPRSIGDARTSLGDVFRQNVPLFGSVFLFSVFVNLLMLSGPIYMLQVYDRVLSSRSEETLLTLTLLIAFLYTMMAALDFARGRVMARAGGRLQTALDRRVYDALLKLSLHKGGGRGATGLQDLEAIQRLYGSPVLLALFDIPWTPFFIAAIFLFHPWLGLLALGGGVVLIVIAALNQRLTAADLRTAQATGTAGDVMAAQLLADGETINALGMREAAFRRWNRLRQTALARSLSASDRSGGFSSATRGLRMFLQSAMLGLGAYLVLREEVSAGVMIASSILLGRGLAPIEQTVGQWAMIQRALEGRSRLIALLDDIPPEPARTTLPRPLARLDVRDLTVVPPGERSAALRMVRFSVAPGQAVGVIGPSGAGKSTLAKALVGLWPPATGSIRLHGATLAQYDPDTLGRTIGYLPQQVRLFDGTIKENIARMDAEPDDAAVVRAAQKADAHEMILQLPDGYDTEIRAANQRLSGGQVQRIGLARALYGDPVLLVLDEPNSNLDNAGSMALNHAIQTMKEDGRSVLIMAHRPAAIQHCDMLLVLEGGMRKAFGPRDEVLRATVANFEDIRRHGGPGGVT
jgi:ATP-binding cassette subfamily C protein